MSDTDAGNVKAKASIEYDPSGMKQFKEDLASLPSMVGGLGQSAGQAGSELENLGEHMSANAESAKSFTSALSELPELTKSGTSAVSEMSGVLSEQRSAIEEAASAHETLQKSVESSISTFEKAPSSIQSVAEHAQSLQAPLETAGKSISQLSESIAQIPMMPRIAGPSFDAKDFGLDLPKENMEIFQGALANPEPFNLIKGYLGETGQAWGDFFSSIGKENVGQLSSIMSFTTPEESRQFMEHYNSVFSSASGGGTVQSIDDLQKLGDTIWATNDAAKSTGETLATLDTSTKNVGKSAQVSADQFSSVGKETGQWVETSNGFMAKLGDVMEGPAYSKPVSLGGAFGEIMGGVTGALNDIAMPLMAVQMISQAVGQVGQAMYDSAAIVEGPAAHSFGTFTGTVDALGQSLQHAAGQFSEGFGQAMLPTLNALSSQAGGLDLGGIGKFAGGVFSTLANLTMIATGINPLGGIEGLINQGADLIGVQQPFQGPPPATKYQQYMASLPQTVRQNTEQLREQTSLTMAEAVNPDYLAQQQQAQAAQTIYQRAQQSYNISHPVNLQKMEDQARYDLYAQQQAENYQYQLNNQPGFFQTLGDVLGINSAPPPSNPNAKSAAQSYGSQYYGQTGYGGGEPSTGGGGGIDIGGFFNGIGKSISDAWNAPNGGADTLGMLFSPKAWGFGGDAEAPAGPVPISTGGCFIAGTPVLLADGSEKAIEALRVDEQVLAYDGKQQVPATIIGCISFPAKQTYELTFDDGNVLITTDSHPLAGGRGWKSISPESTHLENPGLPVTALAVGDDIYTAASTLCRLTSIVKRGIEQVYNITVDGSHTYYASGVLVHNAKQSSLANDGTGSQQVQVSHTFVANVQWEANNLQKQFTGAASWVGQNLSNTFQGAASWVAQGLSNTFQGATTWVAQGLSNIFQGVTSWVAQGLTNTFQGAATWVGQGLQNTFNGVASWVGQGLSNTFKGVASWFGSGLEHTFNAVANWTAQNLSPNFTVNPSFTMLAEGTSNWGGGPAIVGEAGPEVVEHNGQYSMFDAGASLVNLPPGSNVYPMKNLAGSSVAQFANGTGDNVIPITFGVKGSNNNAPESINVYLQIDGQTFWSATGMSLAQSVYAGSGNRSY